ncbi:MAG TPA: alkaline phosphatase family protein [Chloroflexota bacterium]
MSAERAFIMVWDGLRPDYVSPEATPNLWRLAHQGVWFERSHAVYPTLTRANSPAIATGCRPGRAGVPGNTFCLPATGSFNSYTSGDAANLQRLAEADGRPVLLVDTLADRVDRSGGRSVIVGSGSPGCTWLQHPRAPETGDLVVGQGLDNFSSALAALQQRFGPAPRRRVPATEWTTYFTRIICEFVLPELEPTLLVFWHTDPDQTVHPRGHAAPETAQALRDADNNLGSILENYERLGLRGTTDVVVTSDHGSSTITRRVTPTRDLAPLLSSGVAADNGGSAFVYCSEPDAVNAVRSLDYAGPVFTRDGAMGTLPLELVGLDGPRAPDIVFSLAWSDEMVDGLPGTAAGSHGRLLVDHGTISPYDLRNTLIAQGPDFRVGWRDPLPVGNIDIAPTLTHLLDLDPGSAFDGRVLTEALHDGPDAALSFQSVDHTAPFQAHGRDYIQRVTLEHVGQTLYVARGSIDPA